MKISKVALFCALTIVQSMRNLQSTADREELLASALTSMIHEFYIKKSNNIFVLSKVTDENHDFILQKLFTSFDKNASVTWILNDLDNAAHINNVILTESYNSFRITLRSIIATSVDQFGYYTVVLTNFFEDQELNILNIFRESWLNGVVNINILTISEASRPVVLLHTYFPFAPYHCGKVVPIVWNSFENGSFAQTDRELFPQKSENLFQCPISILVAPLRPYIYVTRNHSDASHDFDGIEYKLLHELSKRINFRLNFSVHWDQNLGAIYDNGSAGGAFGMVLEKKTDMVVGALVNEYLVMRIFTTTKAHSHDNIILVVPNPSSYSSFETLSFPFSLTSWTLIIITLGIAVVVIKVLEYNKKEYYEFVVGSKNTSPYLNLLNVFLTGGAFKRPKESFARFLLMLWIITCLILQTVYQGQLFLFIKMNMKRASVNSIDELIERGIYIKLIEDNYLIFLEFDKRLEKLLRFIDGNSEWEFVTDTEAYITMETQLIDDTKRKNFETKSSHKSKTLTITTCAHTMYLWKRFYLKEALDDKITNMNENGLTSKWSAPYQESALFKHDDINIPRQLNVSQIIGLIELWFGILTLATVVFILEILSPSFHVAISTISMSHVAMKERSA